MAQLILIKATQDVIGVYDDTHLFSSTELSKFDLVQIEGTREEIEKQKSDLIGLKGAWKSKTTEWTLDRPEEKLLWTDGEDLKEVVIRTKYPVSYVDGKFVNNIAKNPLNSTVIIIGTKVG